jgi:hypothetical protein
VRNVQLTHCVLEVVGGLAVLVVVGVFVLVIVSTVVVLGVVLDV